MFCIQHLIGNVPDSKVYGANMGPILGRQGSGGLNVDPWTLLSGNPTNVVETIKHKYAMCKHRKVLQQNKYNMLAECKILLYFHDSITD